MTAKPKRKQLVRGRDFDGWAWKLDKGGFYPWVTRTKISVRPWDAGPGKSVRVRFVEVKP